MAAYTAVVEWSLKTGEDFARGRYSRGHTIRFDGGVALPASASPHVVPKLWAVEAAVDPEELLVAALSSCHMLSFLHVARGANLLVRSYRDTAEGVMETGPDGRAAVTRVTLRPAIVYAGEPPDVMTATALHHAAHETCFIANSVKTEVVVEPA